MHSKQFIILIISHIFLYTGGIAVPYGFLLIFPALNFWYIWGSFTISNVQTIYSVLFCLDHFFQTILSGLFCRDYFDQTIFSGLTCLEYSFVLSLLIWYFFSPESLSELSLWDCFAFLIQLSSFKLWKLWQNVTSLLILFLI